MQGKGFQDDNQHFKSYIFFCFLPLHGPHILKDFSIKLSIFLFLTQNHILIQPKLWAIGRNEETWYKGKNRAPQSEKLYECKFCYNKLCDPGQVSQLLWLIISSVKMMTSLLSHRVGMWWELNQRKFPLLLISLGSYDFSFKKKEMWYFPYQQNFGANVFFIMPLEILKTDYCDNSLRPSVGKPWPVPSAGEGLISAACQQ